MIDGVQKYGHVPKSVAYAFVDVEADSGNKSSTRLLSWHNPVYG